MKAIPELTTADICRFWGIAEADEDPERCCLWQGHVNRKGYGFFSIKRKRYRAHRVAWTIDNGPVPDGLHVLHRCDTPGCVNPAHLFTGTNDDNVQDRGSKGRTAKGASNGRAKLTVQQVLQVRLLSGTMTQKAIAALMGVCVATVCDIVRRKTWTHV